MTATPATATGGALVDWPARAAALADELAAAGKLASPAWRAAVQAVPRHLFVPRFYVRRDDRMHALAADDPATSRDWAEQVYTNTALVTKLGHDEPGGPPVYLSSSSTPGLITRMLETLDVHDGHRVLEIGTGTGWNAGLLCHRLGAASVFSVDIDPDLIETARARLAGLGYRPTLAVADGALGLAAHAPYDRLIATCSVPSIPWAWVEQVRVGGVILADLRAGLGAGNLVRLTRTAPDRAEGMFDAGYATFMQLRHTPGSSPVPFMRASADTPVSESATTLDPRTPWSNRVVWFLAALRIGRRYRLGYTRGDPRHGPEAVSIATADGSRAEIALAAGEHGAHAVRETGPARLWQHVEHAHRQWAAADQPDWPRLGLSVTPTQQTIYVDAPGNPLATLTTPAV
ncbi:methyltransferase domain-containing protein [Amycolatopsis sp. NPDC004079]|uniref:methyltransferase domain-containing protein n=1 Tax=Amycolatopsis sp. NPDC004079 TaxID=3154549 RepID=UPI0033BE5D63